MDRNEVERLITDTMAKCLLLADEMMAKLDNNPLPEYGLDQIRIREQFYLAVAFRGSIKRDLTQFLNQVKE